MSDVKSAAERYWVIYYLVYLAAAGVGLYRYWPRLLWYWQQPLLQDDSIYLLAAIFGTALGIALAVAIILEVSGRMVLLIPATVKKIMARGRVEGRDAERERIGAALAKHGVPEDNGETIRINRAELRNILSDNVQGKS